MTTPGAKRVGVVWRAEGPPDEAEEKSRLTRVFNALRQQGLEPVPVPYADEDVSRVRGELLALDAVLVWVDPVSEGQDRSQLDPLLREVAAAGVWVSTHPDTILKMGTKDVLV